MEIRQKKLLLNIAYYCLIGLSFICSVFFILRTIYSAFPNYIKIIYFIWSGILIMNIIYDIFCTNNKGIKILSGIIFVVLALLCVILAIYTFIIQGVSFKVVTMIEITYFINITLSFLPIYLAIIAFIFGQKLIDYNEISVKYIN